MGKLRESEQGRICVLEPDTLVGRSSRSGLFLPERRVSGQHATVRWTGDAWEVRDLGSRNGTFLNGGRLRAGDEHRLTLGDVLSFGGPNDSWHLIDDGPPDVMVVPVSGGSPIEAENGLLAIPSFDDPQFTVFRAADGRWAIESDTGTSTLRDQEVLELGDRMWRFCAPEQILRTSLNGVVAKEVRFLSLAFAVSRDEEHVRVQLAFGSEIIELPARSHHYLLLTLARRRLEDAASGLPDAECGWLDLEDLAHDRSMAGPQLNIDVFRCRRQFADLGVSDSASIIERRPRGKQLRIGTGKLLVARS